MNAHAIHYSLLILACLLSGASGVLASCASAAEPIPDPGRPPPGRSSKRCAKRRAALEGDPRPGRRRHPRRRGTRWPIGPTSARFLSLYDAGHHIETGADGVNTLDRRPGGVAVPRADREVRRADTPSTPRPGKEEILNRRIGRNELAAQQVCLAIADAQREYVRLNGRWAATCRSMPESSSATPARETASTGPPRKANPQPARAARRLGRRRRVRRAARLEDATGRPAAVPRLSVPAAHRPGAARQGRRARLPGGRPPDRRVCASSPTRRSTAIPAS